MRTTFAIILSAVVFTTLQASAIVAPSVPDGAPSIGLLLIAGVALIAVRRLFKAA